MALKKYNQEASGISWFLLLIAFILLLVLAFLAYTRGGQFISVKDNRKSPPVLVVNNAERAFEILANSGSGYKARALDNKEEINIIIPQKNLKAAAIVVLKKYVTAANGLVVYEAQVLSPAPTTKPTGKLPDQPE